MEKKYLILKCEESDESWGREANRTPICLTNDYSNYGYDYEVWEIEENGTLKCIKEYTETDDYGMALYKWQADADAENTIPIVIQKFPKFTRKDMTKEMANSIIKKANFKEVDDFLSNIKYSGQHGEDVDDYWVVFGEYTENSYDLGY